MASLDAGPDRPWRRVGRGVGRCLRPTAPPPDRFGTDRRLAHLLATPDASWSDAPRCVRLHRLSWANVWNRRIDERPVAPNSATMIAAIGLDTGLHMDFGSYDGYGIPYQLVTSGTARSAVAFDYPDESDQVGYPIPANPLIEGGAGATGDRHILM